MVGPAGQPRAVYLDSKNMINLWTRERSGCRCAQPVRCMNTVSLPEIDGLGGKQSIALGTVGQRHPVVLALVFLQIDD